MHVTRRASKDVTLTSGGVVRARIDRILQVLAFLGGIVVTGASLAQVGPPRTTSELGINYNSKLAPLGDFEPLDNSLFGDQVNLYTGEVQFFQTDIELAGNDALPMRVSRSFVPGAKDYSSSPFANWQLDLPYISGVYGKSGWVSMAGPRCSVPLNDIIKASPPSEYVPASSGSNVGFAFDPHFYWTGNSLHLPGQGNQRMLVASAGAKVPSDGRAYHWVTSGRWAFSCLPTTANGLPGEAFLAQAPDGTRYWFDWIVSSSAGSMEGWFGNGAFQYVSRMSLLNYKALPTRIEDVHGNYITYTYYGPNLGVVQSMSASDGRSIVFRSIDLSEMQVDADGRTWTYRFTADPNDRKLQSLTLPDGSSWSFNTGVLSSNPLHGWRNCADFVPGGDSTTTITMTHPSGASGTFNLGRRLHGRTGAKYSCRSYGPTPLPVESHILSAVSIYRKDISGPGMAPLSWSYQYSPLAASLDTGQHVICQTTPCPETRDVTVTREDGSWDRYTYSQKYGDLEGQLLREERGTSSGVVRRTEYTYRRMSDGSYGRVGTDPCWVCAKEDELPKPLESRSTEQDGKMYTLRVEQYDSLARPVRQVRSSSP